ncbi:MAG: tetratricopeptide repeat protein [Candidatus Latescibacteria bacterium]|nr:tetratricopeptide repeat protein [Candidatus Latescibacterota bacterium]
MSEAHKALLPRIGTGALPLLLVAAFAGSGFADPGLIRIIPSEFEFLARSTLAQESGDLDGASVWAEALSTEDPRSSFAAGRLAQILESAGDDTRALEWGDRALKLDSLNADAAMLVGRMMLRSGDAAIAVKALTPPLRLLGARPELYALRALAHELNRNYEAALADLKRTGTLRPDFTWIATGVLRLALEDARLREASQALDLALELNPDDPQILGLGIELARRLGDVTLEETLLERRASADDASAEHCSAYASFLIRMGQTKALDGYLERVRRRGIDPGDVRIESGRSLLRDGHYRAALEAVKPVGGRNAALPVRARALVAMADEKPALACYRKLGMLRAWTREESLVVAYLEIRVGDRRAGIRTLEQIRPGLLESPRRLLAGSFCYVLLGHPEEAVRLLREGTARGIESPSVYAELGATAAEIGDSLVAEWAYQRLDGLGRETSECLYFLSVRDLNQGFAERAVQRLERSVAIDPNNARALALLGRIRYRMGQLELARELLRRAVESREAGADAHHLLARVCRALRLESEARAAESGARGKRAPSSPPGLTLFSNP